MLVPALSLVLLVAPPLSTEGERSGYLRTGRYDEVLTLCAAFARAYPSQARCERFGVTPEGRPMVALVAGHGPTRVYLQGGIHAGEIDGKDAGFWLLRELLSGRELKGALDKLTVVFVPVVNPDGHERFGRHQRPNQNGPEEMGWRVTAHNLNLNRDHAKAEAPEMVALLGLLQRYDPLLYVDLHVTDGAKFQHDVAVVLEPLDVGPEPLRPLGLALRQAVFSELEKEGHLPLPFYPSFREPDDPASGFAHGVPPPRFSHGYWMLRNRFGVLVETHSWKDYKTRVTLTFEVARALVRQAMVDGGKWREAAKAADAAASRADAAPLVLSYKNTAESRTFEFLGYAYSRTPSSVSGSTAIRYDDTQPQVWKVPLFEKLEPGLTVHPPAKGYLVPRAHAQWLAKKLSQHGIAFEVLARPRSKAAVETFRATAVERSAETFEGRARLRLEGAWAKDTQDLLAGSLFVPIAQPKRALVAHLLEPAGPDSYLQWGYFNAAFEQKEYMEDYVAEEVARTLLQDPAVKAEFEAKLAKDPAFAKSPAARLEFFYRKTPSFDPRWNLYPVYRE